MCSATPITVIVGSTHDSASSFCTAAGVHKTSANNVCYLFCLYSSLEVHGRTDMWQIGLSILMFTKVSSRIFTGGMFPACTIHWVSGYLSPKGLYSFEFRCVSLSLSLYLCPVLLLARIRFTFVASLSLSLCLCLSLGKKSFQLRCVTLALSGSFCFLARIRFTFVASPSPSNPPIQFYHCKY